MKVLFVSDSTTVSGAELVLLGCVDGLSAAGHLAHGFVRNTNTRLIDAFGDRDIAVTATPSLSDRIIRTTANPIDLFTFSQSFQAVAREIAQVVRRARVDVIHSISYPASLYAAFATRRTRTPHIWHEHNIKRIHRFNRAIYRWVGSTCRWVIGPSDAVTNNLVSAGIDRAKLRTVYNGIDLSRFRTTPADPCETLRRELGIEPGDAAIGLFGQMLPYKGHNTLIEAAPQILNAHPRTRFYFVGALENPPYEQQLRSRIASAGLSDRFCFTGWRSDVQRIVSAMDVVVVATTTPEPAALMLMEAMATGRPVVATRTGGTPEIIVDGNTGLLFQPGNPHELAHRLKRILGEPELGATLGTAGRGRVECEFSLDRHLRVMFGLYEQAASLPSGTLTSHGVRGSVSAIPAR